LTGQTKPGSSLDTTNKVALELEEIIKQQPEVASYLVSVGGGGGSAVQNPTIISMPLTLKPRDERKLNHVQVMDELRKKLKSVKGIKASMRDISARNLTTGKLNPISFNLRGANLATLSEKVAEIIERLEKEGLAIDLDTDYRKGIPELLVTPDRKAMSLRGVSAESVSQLLQIAVGGYRQGQYTNDGKRYDIRFKIPDELISSPEDIKNLEVRNNVGNRLPLKDFVVMGPNDVSQSITRINRQRSMSVFGNLAPGKSQAAVLDRAKEIATEILPPGYSFALEGASAGFSQSFSSLFSALMIGILVAYLILAVQFDSFIHPISVLMALPFSATGALLTLWLTGTSLNLFSFIGLIVLMGIAKKNSIMLVEFTNQLRAGGVGVVGGSAEQALLQACPVRLRPILMTSVATVAAAFPLILGHGIGSETRGPMGLTIIGGTIVSTILTLFVVPALYLLLTRFEKKRG
jgi:multidrug efflux pump subunit AcrB